MVLNQKGDIGIFRNILVLVLNDFLNLQSEKQLTHILIYRT